MAPFFIYTGVILMMPFIFSGHKTTVVLLDNNQSKNGVVVTTAAGSIEIDRPNMQTIVSSPDEKPEAVKNVDPEEIQQKYVQTLEALPPHPESLIFYFENNSVELTSESKDQTQALIDVIKRREPCVVDIIGHTDTKASTQSNYHLALKRAESLKSFLDAYHVQLSEVHIESYGEGTLLVPTADGVDEPRNRRVEVIVR
jgi:outer membrane protein OmpA-like peptidoglycan-associated protein